MIYIDKYAYISALKDTKPELKLLFGLSSLIAAICSKELVSYALVLAVMFFITVIKAKIPFTYYLKLMSLCLGFLVFGVIGIIISISNTDNTSAVFSINIIGHYVYVTNENVILAVHLALKSLAAVSCLYFIILTTPIRDIIYFLQLAKCPGTILTLIMMTYRFIFLLMDIAVVKLKSQQCRHGYNSAKRFTKTFGMLWGSVFIQSFIASEWVYKAMLVRGHESNIKLLKKDVSITAVEIAAVLLFLAVIALPNYI